MGNYDDVIQQSEKCSKIYRNGERFFGIFQRLFEVSM